MEALSAPQARQTVSTLRETRELAIDSGSSTSNVLAEDPKPQDAGKKSIYPSKALHARKASTSEKSKKQFGGIGLGGPSAGASRPAANGLSSQGQADRDGMPAKAFPENGSRNVVHRQTPSLSLSGRMPSARRASIATHSPTSPPSSHSPSFGRLSRSSYNSKFKQIQSQTLSGRVLNYISRHSARQILLSLLFTGLAIFFLASLLGYGSNRRSGQLRLPNRHGLGSKVDGHKNVQGEYEHLSGERYAQEEGGARRQDTGGKGTGRGRPARIPKEAFADENMYKDEEEAPAKKLPPLAMRKQRLSPAGQQEEGDKARARPVTSDELDTVPDRARAAVAAVAGGEADMFERNLALNKARQGAS